MFVVVPRGLLLLLQLLELSGQNLTAWLCAVDPRCAAYTRENDGNCGDKLCTARTEFQVSAVFSLHCYECER